MHMSCKNKIMGQLHRIELFVGIPESGTRRDGTHPTEVVLEEGYYLLVCMYSLEMFTTELPDWYMPFVSDCSNYFLDDHFSIIYFKDYGVAKEFLTRAMDRDEDCGECRGICLDEKDLNYQTGHKFLLDF